MKALTKTSDPCDRSCTCALKGLKGQRGEIVRRGRFFELPKKATVYEQGVPYGGVYLVCRGLLKLARRTETGRLQVIALVGAGDVVGIEQLAGAEPYDHYAQTLTSCRLFHLTCSEFQAALAVPDFARVTLSGVLNALRSRHHHLHHVLGRGVRARLLFSLRDWARRFGEPNEDGIELNLDLVNEDWAGWVGSTPQSVSTAFAQLNRQGLVARRARRIVLRSQPSMEWG